MPLEYQQILGKLETAGLTPDGVLLQGDFALLSGLLASSQSW
jgi:hypothetical protein